VCYRQPGALRSPAWFPIVRVGGSLSKAAERLKPENHMSTTAERLTEPDTIDATVYGDVSEDILNRVTHMAFSQAGKDTKQGRWRNVIGDVRNALNSWLAVHPEASAKDGPCALAGSLVGYDRKTDAVDSMYWLTLDLDCGDDFQAVRERVQALGLFAVLHTSWSNGRAETDTKKDAVLRWLGKGVTDATVRTCATTFVW
jgi:hypothetical protein